MVQTCSPESVHTWLPPTMRTVTEPAQERCYSVATLLLSVCFSCDFHITHLFYNEFYFLSLRTKSLRKPRCFNGRKTSHPKKFLVKYFSFSKKNCFPQKSSGGLQVHRFYANSDQFSFFPGPADHDDPSLSNDKKTFFQISHPGNSAPSLISKPLQAESSVTKSLKEFLIIPSYWNPFTCLFSFFTFDCTLGFPGEGSRKNWNKREKILSIACYNSRSLTFERFSYLKSLEIDILDLTETWGKDHEFVNDTCSWTHSQPELKENGDLRFPNDPAAGVDILLSRRAQDKLIKCGSPCKRPSRLG